MSYLLPSLTATRSQASAYLFGIALFSIAFLVFLNASISFVITYVIGQHHAVGDTVGTLGFADELLALVACPMWGLLSDRIGVRTVAALGYCIVGVSLVCLVQSENVYPQLLISRLGFSIGGAACSTMVTAVLPTMVMKKKKKKDCEAVRGTDTDQAGRETGPDGREAWRPGHSRGSSRTSQAHTPSICSEITITPQRYNSLNSDMRRRLLRQGHHIEKEPSKESDTSRLAGFVGMFTGLGALLALVVFLPLPAYLHDTGRDWVMSVRLSFYIVATFAFLVAIYVSIGLRNLPGEEGKGLLNLFQVGFARTRKSDQEAATAEPATLGKPHGAPSYLTLISASFKLGFTDSSISLGYLGGFVARASSVGISLFIPLFVNAYFIRTGLCSPNNDDDRFGKNPSDIKDNCKDAYKVAQALAGIAETAALVCAPIFGWLGGASAVKNKRVSRPGVSGEWPLLSATLAGIIGYTMFGLLKNPDAFHGKGGSRWAFLAVILIGISQIGAIVCSLGLLARGIQSSSTVISVHSRNTSSNSARLGDHNAPEAAPLLADVSPPTDASTSLTPNVDRLHLKGSIAGIYSFAGGAGILLLTKVGGLLFDEWSPGVPFFMLAIANAMLFVAVVVISGATAFTSRHEPLYEGDEYRGEDT